MKRPAWYVHGINGVMDPRTEIAMPVDTHPIRILSQRLSIEPFCEQDAAESFPCLTPSLTRYMSWEPPASLEEYAQVWEQWLPAIADGSDIVFTVRELVSARLPAWSGCTIPAVKHRSWVSGSVKINTGWALVVKRCGRLFSGLASGWRRSASSTLLRRRTVRVDVLPKLWGESSLRGG